MTCDFQQFDILTSVDSDEPVQPPFKLRASKRCLVSSLTLIEYSSDEQRLWSDCAYALAQLIVQHQLKIIISQVMAIFHTMDEIFWYLQE